MALLGELCSHAGGMQEVDTHAWWLLPTTDEFLAEGFSGAHQPHRVACVLNKAIALHFSAPVHFQGPLPHPTHVSCSAQGQVVHLQSGQAARPPLMRCLCHPCQA